MFKETQTNNDSLYYDESNHNGDVDNLIEDLSHSPIEKIANKELIQYLNDNSYKYEILEKLSNRTIILEKEIEELERHPNKIYIIINSNPDWMNKLFTGNVDLIITTGDKTKTIFVEYQSYEFHLSKCLQGRTFNIQSDFLKDKYMEVEKITWVKDMTKANNIQLHGYKIFQIAGPQIKKCQSYLIFKTIFETIFKKEKWEEIKLTDLKEV